MPYAFEYAIYHSLDDTFDFRTYRLHGEYFAGLPTFIFSMIDSAISHAQLPRAADTAAQCASLRAGFRQRKYGRMPLERRARDVDCRRGDDDVIAIDDDTLMSSWPRRS